jgi:hypothetical protein
MATHGARSEVGQFREAPAKRKLADLTRGEKVAMFGFRSAFASALRRMNEAIFELLFHWRRRKNTASLKQEKANPNLL